MQSLQGQVPSVKAKQKCEDVICRIKQSTVLVGKGLQRSGWRPAAIWDCQQLPNRVKVAWESGDGEKHVDEGCSVEVDVEV